MLTEGKQQANDRTPSLGTRVDVRDAAVRQRPRAAFGGDPNVWCAERHAKSAGIDRIGMSQLDPCA